MKLNKEILNEWYGETGGAFYLLDKDRLSENYLELFGATTKGYPNSTIAYSYKTNYLPAVCKHLHSLGAWAEVVSNIEYDLAIRNGVSPEEIIVNGPFHKEDFMHRCLQDRSQLNIDSWYQLPIVERFCQAHPSNTIRIGLRFTFPIVDGSASRFGFEYTSENVDRLRSWLESVPNLQVTALHCHFSTGKRTLASFKDRLEQLIAIHRDHFQDQPIRQINCGGGFFSPMPESLRKQFGQVPTLVEYGSILGETMAVHYGEGDSVKLVLEPGTAIAANCMSFITKVVDIKEISGKNYLLVDGSVHTVKPTQNTKDLPLVVLNDGTAPPGHYNIVGYTCMETDVINTNQELQAGVGDMMVFENVGGYTTVFKPPFIRLHPPIYELAEGNKRRLIKRKETVDDLVQTYLA